MRTIFLLAALLLAGVLTLLAQNQTKTGAIINQQGRFHKDTIIVNSSTDTFKIILSDIIPLIISRPDVDEFELVDTAAEQFAFEEPKAGNSFLSHLAVSLRINTLGVGIEMATPLNNRFRLRVGVDLFPANLGYHSLDLRKELRNIEYAFGYVPDYRAKWNINFYNGYALVDFHPIKKSIFHLTAGLYLGSSKVNLKGYLSDRDNNPSELLPGYGWPVFEYENQTVDLTGGIMNFDLQLGNAVKPYLGLGVGDIVSKKRFGFKFEIGVLYQGEYSLKQNGIKVNFKETTLKDFDDFNDYTQWLKIWPMVNFQFIYRIF